MPIINLNSTNFIKNDQDLAHKDVVTIANEGGWEVSERFKKDDGTPSNVFRINLKLKNGDVKSTTLNFSNLKLLASGFGEDSAGWVGKEVRAWKTKSEKAKLGYTYVFVPTDWNRDEIGEWNNAEGKPITIEKNDKPAVQDAQKDYDALGSVEEIEPGDIPF